MRADGERRQVTVPTLEREPEIDVGCDHCDGPGSALTYRNQMLMPLNGRVQCIDWCIGHVVAALNAANIRTTASCCGHKLFPGRIDLKDGRVLAVFDDAESAIELCWPGHVGT